MEEQKEQDLQKELDQLGNDLKQAKKEEYAAAQRKYKVISALFSWGATIMLLISEYVGNLSGGSFILFMVSNGIAGIVWVAGAGDDEFYQGLLIAWSSFFVPCILDLFAVGADRIVGIFIGAVIYPVLLACLPWFLGGWLGEKICASSSKK